MFFPILFQETILLMPHDQINFHLTVFWNQYELKFSSSYFLKQTYQMGEYLFQNGITLHKLHIFHEDA